MSFSYYRIIPEPVSYRMYGFETVSAKQVQAINRRLQKPTYGTDFIHRQCFQTEASPPRPAPVTCKRAQSAGVPSPDQQVASFSTQRDLEKAIRRIAAPTLSRMAAEGKIAASYDTNFEQQSHNIEERTTIDQVKALQKIRRPTTASKTKSRELQDEYVCIEYLNKPAVTNEYIQTITDRVSTPTVASEGGIGPTCPKRRDSVGKKGFAKQMPLISGLERSKNVSEIVNRLYTPPNTSMGFRQSRQKPRPERPKSSIVRRPSSSISRKSTLSTASEPPPNFSVHITKKKMQYLRETAWGFSEDVQDIGSNEESTKLQENNDINNDITFD